MIQVYGPTTAATDEEMQRFYQDLSQAVKQVPKGDMLLVMGDFYAKVGRRQPSAMSSVVGLYGLGEQIKLVSSSKTSAWSTSWLWPIPCLEQHPGCIPGPLMTATPGIR